MYRLLQRAAELDETFAKTAEFSIDSKGHLEAEFADITQAIHIVQTEMGITGTTALEAGRTISGSVGSMKAAWQNLLTGLADGNADVEFLIEDLVTTIVGDGTENNLGVIGNVLPAIETALGGIAKLIEGAAPKIIEILPGLVERIVPSVISAATGMVDAVVKVVPDLLNTVVDAIINNAPALIDSAIVLIGELSNGILNQLPQIVQLGLDLIVSLANGITKSLPKLIPTIIDVVLQIVDTLTNPETLSNLLGAALTLIMALMEGFLNPESIEKVYNAIFDLVDNIIEFLLDEENLSKIITAAFKIVVALGMGMLKQREQLAKTTIKLVGSIVESIFTTDWGKIGKNIVDGLLDGLKNMWEKLKNWFTDAWDSWVDNIWKTITTFFTDIWNDITEFFSKAWEGIKTFLDNPAYYIGYVIGWILGQIKKFFTKTIPEAWNAFTTWLSESFEKLKETIKTFFTETIPNAWSNLKTKTKELFESIGKTITNFFTVTIPRKWEDFKTNVKEKINSIKDWFKDLPNQLKDIGKNIVEGLWNGIKNAWNWLKDKVGGLFGNLVQGIKDGLLIRSPSRLFRDEIGKMMALGVGEGWDDAFGDVKDDIDSSLDFGEADYGITTSTTSIGDFGGGSARYGYGGSQNVNVTVGIDNNANAMGLARALLPFLKIAEKEAYV